jgi:hypothetical protein
MRSSTKQASNGPDYQPKFMDTAAFAKAKYPRGWLIERILVRGQPGVIGGARKAGGLDLDDRACAGVAEFVRQGVPVGRRTPYAPGTGAHDRVPAVGGSAGHAGAWAVTVREGVLKADFTGRKRAVQVKPLAGATAVQQGK